MSGLCLHTTAPCLWSPPGFHSVPPLSTPPLLWFLPLSNARTSCTFALFSISPSRYQGLRCAFSYRQPGTLWSLLSPFPCPHTTCTMAVLNGTTSPGAIPGGHFYLGASFLLTVRLVLKRFPNPGFYPKGPLLFPFFHRWFPHEPFPPSTPEVFWFGAVHSARTLARTRLFHKPS